jgi:hypothetical protein
MHNYIKMLKPNLKQIDSSKQPSLDFEVCCRPAILLFPKFLICYEMWRKVLTVNIRGVQCLTYIHNFYKSTSSLKIIFNKAFFNSVLCQIQRNIVIYDIDD